MRSLKSAAIMAALFFVAACGGGAGAVGCSMGGGSSAPQAAGPRIVLNANSPRPTIDVVGVPPEQLALIAGADSREAWTAILKVAAGIDQPAAVGQYSIENDVVRFTPMFPLEKGRQYHVTFTAPGGASVTGTVGLPPPDTTPTTSVTEVYPTADVLPENQLRVYIQFSASMGARGALDFVHLIDDAGQEVKDPFLPLDADSWNDDRTRYTVVFDPAHRTLTAGKAYTLVIDYAWPDAHGLQLTQTVDRKFTVGPPDHTLLDPKTWKIDAPGTESSALVVTFPEPLDHGTLMRALGVLSPTGRPLDGQVVVSNHELTWTFTPAEMWKPGAYNIVVFAMLEDLAGNRMGRLFDAARFDRADQGTESEKTLIPFVVH